MKQTIATTLHILLATTLCLLPSVIGTAQTSRAMPDKAITLAKHYLQTIERSASFATGGGREDIVFVGHSRGSSDGWRVLIVADDRKPKVVWDSFSLRDPYFDSMGSNSIDYYADGQNEFVVTLRGCAPHQCFDGRLGFAAYASRSRRVYKSHVLTKDDGSYEVTFYPKSGLPDTYRAELVRMMCSDSGISQPSALPIKCSAK